ncbi:hypothetical protein FGO68_gene17746 [Halteria grandinella]|uniref:Uncharacterized protein n=1 Tax=Halteria grandinella TaxID=5974 RepID=A0A8J8NBT8_HALGN|nr:hypothetical protein FGO68_gene17746 [Halteria grandinella]
MESRGEGISKKSHSQLDIPFKKLGSIKQKKRSSIQSGSQTSRQDKDKKKSSNVLNVPMFDRTGTIKDSIGAKIEELLVEEKSSSSSDSSINFTKKSTVKEEYKVEQFYREINNEIKSPKVDLEEEKVSLEFGNEGAQAFESDQEDPISQQMGQNQFRHESPFVKTQIHQKLSKNDIFKSPRVDTAPQIFLQFSPSKHVTHNITPNQQLDYQQQQQRMDVDFEMSEELERELITEYEKRALEEDRKQRRHNF